MSRTNSPLLVIDASVDASVEAEWTGWYEDTYLPRISERAGVFQSVRFVSRLGGGIRHVSVHGVEGPGVVNPNEFAARPAWDQFAQNVQATARFYQPLDPSSTFPLDISHLLLVDATIEPSVETEWNRWYNDRHMPLIAECPGFVRSARYVSTVGGGTRYLSLYHLESPEALATEEFAARRGWEQFAPHVQATVRRFERMLTPSS